MPPEDPAGRELITERPLRRLLESRVWEDQRALWAELHHRMEPGSSSTAPDSIGT